MAARKREDASGKRKGSRRESEQWTPCEQPKDFSSEDHGYEEDIEALCIGCGYHPELGCSSNCPHLASTNRCDNGEISAGALGTDMSVANISKDK